MEPSAACTPTRRDSAAGGTGGAAVSLAAGHEGAVASAQHLFDFRLGLDGQCGEAFVIDYGGTEA